MSLRSISVFLAAALFGQSAAAAEGALDVPGGRIAYESCKPEAARQTVILIHDGTLDAAVWNGVFPILCEKFQTVRFDHRGYGKSPPSTEPYSSVDDIGLVMKGLQIDRAALVGASANGGRAITYALDHPQAVESLVLVGPSIPGAPYSKEFIAEIMPFAQAINKGDQDGARALAEQWGHLVKKENASAQKELGRLLRLRTFQAKSLDAPGKAILDRLPEVKQRTMVIVGNSDHPNNMDHAKIAHTKIAGSSFVVMKDTAHLPFLERPREFAELVIDFLADRP